MLTLFENLPDLVLIEILSYFSCVDGVYAFSNLNSCVTALLIERRFYHHVNLSSGRYNHFQSVLLLLRLNEIESLLIDWYASPLQLRRWPHLSHLKILRVKGVRDLYDVFNFIKEHTATLTHLTIETSTSFSTSGITVDIVYPSWNLCEFIKHIFNSCHALQSVDFGMENTFRLHQWPLRKMEIHLTYLRLTLLTPFVLYQLMSTESISGRLKSFHIRLSDQGSDPQPRLPDKNIWPRMEVLHTFTLIKSFTWYFNKEWDLIDKLTSSDTMPILQRMNFSIVINMNDLDRMYHSSLFTDHRHVDVHYAWMINDNVEHIRLINYLENNNKQSNRRQIDSATFLCNTCSNDSSFRSIDKYYNKTPQNRQHIFYTLPWIFGEFVELCVPDNCISHFESFPSSCSSDNYCCSRLVKLNISDNCSSCAASLPDLISSNDIVEVHLSRCDREILMDFPSVSRLILTDSLDSLNSSMLRFGNNDWTVLRRLGTLPRLMSLRLILYNMRFPPSDETCQIIAETAPIVCDFSFCFRRLADEIDYDVDAVYMEHSLFIKQLQNRILALPLNEQPYVIIEEDGHGIIIWF